MRRVAHDLAGSAQRISRLAERLAEEIEVTEQLWRDQRGQAFLREHLAPCRPNIAQLVSGINETVELFDEIAKKLHDPDHLQ